MRREDFELTVLPIAALYAEVPANKLFLTIA
jgi:hypothetical protein